MDSIGSVSNFLRRCALMISLGISLISFLSSGSVVCLDFGPLWEFLEFLLIDLVSYSGYGNRSVTG